MKPYVVLRTIAGFIEYAGIVIFIFGWLSVLYWFTIGFQTYRNIEVPMFAPTLMQFIWDASAVLSVMFALVCSVLGMLTIASGQVIKLLIDIRDGTYANVQATRRLGIHPSEENRT